MHVPATTATEIAVAFVWAGMILGISFLEAPLKFRAPGITVALGVGIGRLVFRTLNAVEAVLATALVVAVIAMWGETSTVRLCTLAALCVSFAIGAGILRPLMDQRVAAGRASTSMPKSSLHLWYAVLEGVKVVLLIAFGIMAMGSLTG